MKVIHVNSNISKDDLAILKRFLRLFSDTENCLEAGEHFKIRDQEYQVADTIVRRPKASNPKEFVFEVISLSTLGKGGFSSVHKVRGVLKYDQDGNLIFQKKEADKKRKAKIYDLSGSNTPRKVLEEFQLIKGIKHLHAKEPV
ncbi:hypothetical protein [Legionella sp. W05-934-2]|uniref:hypothetical protein n=1 Tax=Legionella sp. W05-934-2 TaxID=1198649 RepID=UPI0034626A89